MFDKGAIPVRDIYGLTDPSRRCFWLDEPTATKSSRLFEAPASQFAAEMRTPPKPLA